MTILRLIVDGLLVVAVALLVVRLAGLDRGFPLAALMTVFPYVVALTGLLTVAALMLGAWPEDAVGFVAFAVGVTLLAPRVLPDPSPADVPTGPELTVAVSNLRFGQGDAPTVVAAVDELGIDVLVVLEMTDRAIARLDQAEIGDRLPHSVLLASRLTSGGGIYSRYPLTARDPSRQRRYGATPRVTVELPDGARVDVDAVHPLPPTGRDWTTSWDEGLRSLPSPAVTTDGQHFRILAGDFNASHDHSGFRALLGRGWVDAADARGKALRSTFSALRYGEPVPPVTLDHVLVPSDVAVEAVTFRPIPRSDHRMLVVELRLPAR